MTNDENSLIEGLIEEMEKLGADNSMTIMEIKKDGKIYSFAVRIRLLGEERVQQNE